MRRSYAVLGTGAVGGFYGARLQKAGCDVHFLRLDLVSRTSIYIIRDRDFV